MAHGKCASSHKIFKFCVRNRLKLKMLFAEHSAQFFWACSCEFMSYVVISNSSIVLFEPVLYSELADKTNLNN